MIKNGKSIHGLSAKSYTDQQFWETECNTVLANGWLFVGFVHELLNPGDVAPILIAGKPILLIRNKQNEIKFTDVKGRSAIPFLTCFFLYKKNTF